MRRVLFGIDFFFFPPPFIVFVFPVIADSDFVNVIFVALEYASRRSEISHIQVVCHM